MAFQSGVLGFEGEALLLLLACGKLICLFFFLAHSRSSSRLSRLDNNSGQTKNQHMVLPVSPVRHPEICN